FGLPLRELAYAQLPLEEVLDEPFLGERLAESASWEARFRLLDEVFARRLDTAPPPVEVEWAWRALVAAGGGPRVARLAERLGWSRKRLAAGFAEHVGVPPKTLARIARFERARAPAKSS